MKESFDSVRRMAHVVGRYQCVPTSRNGWYLSVGGHLYRKQCNLQKGLLYWVCTEWKSKSCHARAHSTAVDENGVVDFVRLSHTHSHFANDAKAECTVAIHDLKTEATGNDNPISALLTRKMRSEPSLKETESRRSVYMKMYRARHKNRPAIPHRVEDFHVREKLLH